MPDSKILPIDIFLQELQRKNAVLLDVRSTAEFNRAKIPGAVSLPLLDDEHRKIIGTTYKQEGREAAVLKGFELVGPLFHEKIQKAIELAPQKEVFMYCWRGGMRSNIMAWMLRMSGFKVYLLEGGYKSFRHWALAELEKPKYIIILGGKTGSGKTEILSLLKSEGENTIDLEACANHKGSAFGTLGMPAQPTQEHFENLIAWELAKLNPDERIWMENESRAIGKINVPNVLFDAMRIAPLVDMEVDIVKRKERILNEYGIFPVEDLAEKTKKIEKRLGGLNLKKALSSLEEGDLSAWLDIILWYYDKTYLHGNDERKNVIIQNVKIDWDDPASDLQKIINAADQIKMQNNMR